MEKAEDVLFGFGFTDFRVRVLGETAKMQFPQGQMLNLLNKRQEVVKAIKQYFPTVLLDLEGRHET